MKKIFLFCMMALVGMCGLNSCSDDCNHEFIEYDHSADLVGTWTCLAEDYAEALVIKADGSVVSTGIEDGEYWESVKGNIKTVNNKMTMIFEDDDNWEGRFEMVAGVAFTIYEENGESFTFHYCENDLSEEIVGMWVCNDGPTTAKEDMMIQVFNEDGSSVMTGYADEIHVNDKSTSYKVVGDLVFLIMNKESVKYEAFRMTYSPNGTAFGDVMALTLAVNNENIAPTTSWLRIKQNLDLASKAYDYSATYISNVKGLDEDMTMMGYTFNIGKMEGKNLDKMLKTLLFAVEFPNANTIKYQYHYNGQNLVFEAPIVVDGNKVTIKMSEFSSYYRDVDMYMFQDKDNTQLHMYMPTYAFINYFANMDLAALAFAGEIDLTDEAAVKAIFDRMDERVESINVSFTFKAAK